VWAESVFLTSSDLLIPHPGLNDRTYWQRELAELLGVAAAADAIASARVHSGMVTDTAHEARPEHRMSGSWDIVS
jgi:hypothetical protein